MKVGCRPAIVAGVVVAALMGLAPGTGHAQGLNKVIEGVFPTQLVPGQTTVINIAMNGGRNNKVTAVQVSPNAGITIGTMIMIIARANRPVGICLDSHRVKRRHRR